MAAQSHFPGNPHHGAIAPDTVIDHYRVIRSIGSGGMGDVYLAMDTALERQVALKFLSGPLSSDEPSTARFQREARATAALSHPNIVTIHQVSKFAGRPYFAMEYLQGQSLHELIHEQELTLWQILDLSIQIVSGLDAAHAASIVHRDIKPSNMVMAGSGVVKILDFGLASIVGKSRLTHSHSTLGTIGYMSPEQVQGRAVDARSDLFSFGVVLYEMISRHQPFKRDYEAATVFSIVNHEPEPLANYRTDVPGEMQRIVAKCLTKDPQLRYQTAADLLADLRRERDSYSSAGSIRVESRSSSPRSHSRVVVLAMLLVAGAGYLLYALLWPRERPVTAATQTQITFSGGG